MNRLNVGFDVDDVLLPSSDHATRLHNELYGTNVSRENWYRNIPTSNWNADTEDEVIARVNEILNSEKYLEGIVPMDGAMDVLDEMDEAGDLRFAVTSRPPLLAAMTLRVLDVCYPGKFTADKITFINHSTATTSVNALQKVQIALAEEATHFVDDFEHHLLPMVRVGITPLLFGEDYPWNVGASQTMRRTENWSVLGAYLANERTHDTAR